MVFPIFFLYNKIVVIAPPPGEAAEFAAELQGEAMGIYKISLDKRDLSPIIRQTEQDRISLSFFSCVQVQLHNAVSRGALRPRSFRGRGASFLRFGSSGVLGEGVSEACIAAKLALLW